MINEHYIKTMFKIKSYLHIEYAEKKLQIFSVFIGIFFLSDANHVCNFLAKHIVALQDQNTHGKLIFLVCRYITSSKLRF